MARAGATTVRKERVRVGRGRGRIGDSGEPRDAWAACVYATNHTADELSLEQGVAAYRGEYVIEQGFGRLKGRSLSLTPLLLHFEHRIRGLIYLLTIGIRVLVLIQFTRRRNLQKEGVTLKGIYPGQPGGQTSSPTTEMMLRSFRGLTLSRIIIDGKAHDHLKPLNKAPQAHSRIDGIAAGNLFRTCDLIFKYRFSIARNVRFEI